LTNMDLVSNFRGLHLLIGFGSQDGPSNPISSGAKRLFSAV
jgi:hypothetical protein